MAESPSPRLLITKWDIDTPNELTVKCVVSLSRRKNVGRTNQPVEFNMRKAHLEMFTVTRTYDITDGVRAGQRTLALSNKRKVISKKKKDEDKKKPRYDPVTRQLVPPGEKKRADQPYHRIEEELAKIRRDHASRIPPLLDAKVSSPVQGPYLPPLSLSRFPCSFLWGPFVPSVAMKSSSGAGRFSNRVSADPRGLLVNMQAMWNAWNSRRSISSAQQKESMKSSSVTACASSTTRVP